MVYRDNISAEGNGSLFKFIWTHTETLRAESTYLKSALGSARKLLALGSDCSFEEKRLQHLLTPSGFLSLNLLMELTRLFHVHLNHILCHLLLFIGSELFPSREFYPTRLRLHSYYTLKRDYSSRSRLLGWRNHNWRQYGLLLCFSTTELGHQRWR